MITWTTGNAWGCVDRDSGDARGCLQGLQGMLGASYRDYRECSGLATGTTGNALGCVDRDDRGCSGLSTGTPENARVSLQGMRRALQEMFGVCTAGGCHPRLGVGISQTGWLPPGLGRVSAQ